MNATKNIIVIGALLTGVSIILGAFAAHALKSYVPASSVESFKTGVEYARFHGLALVLIALIPEHFLHLRQKKLVSILILIGSIMFSFSIFFLVMNKIWQVEWLKIMGPITPLGGVIMILAWFLLAHYVFYSRRN